MTSSGGAAVSFGGGPGRLRRGGGQVDRRSAAAGGRGEEDLDQAVLLRGKVLHILTPSRGAPQVYCL